MTSWAMLSAPPAPPASEPLFPILLSAALKWTPLKNFKTLQQRRKCFQSCQIAWDHYNSAVIRAALTVKTEIPAHFSYCSLLCNTVFLLKLGKIYQKLQLILDLYLFISIILDALNKHFFSSYRSTVLHNELHRRKRAGISILTVSNKTWFPSCSDTKRTA
jgi:hypothetical protein